MVDFDRMRGMHDYYGGADAPLYTEAGKAVDVDDAHTEHELDAVFQADLDDHHPVVVIAGYEYDAGLALKTLDPTAYRQAFLDWIDANYELLYEANGDESDYYTEKED